MSHDYDFIEMEHATAVAAAAFAISSHVSEIPHEQKMWEFPETSLTKTRSKAYDKKSSFSQIGAASKRLSGKFLFFLIRYSLCVTAYANPLK